VSTKDGKTMVEHSAALDLFFFFDNWRWIGGGVRGHVYRSPTLFEDMVKCILLCNCHPFVRARVCVHTRCGRNNGG